MGIMRGMASLSSRALRVAFTPLKRMLSSFLNERAEFPESRRIAEKALGFHEDAVWEPRLGFHPGQRGAGGGGRARSAARKPETTCSSSGICRATSRRTWTGT